VRCWNRRSELSLGVVLAENDVNPGDAVGPEIEGFHLMRGHANEDFGQTRIVLLLHEG